MKFKVFLKNGLYLSLLPAARTRDYKWFSDHTMQAHTLSQTMQAHTLSQTMQAHTHCPKLCRPTHTVPNYASPHTLSQTMQAHTHCPRPNLNLRH